MRISQSSGRPRTRPEQVVADRSFDADRVRKALRRRKHPGHESKKAFTQGTKTQEKRSVIRWPHHRFDRQVYRKRGGIEQNMGCLKENRPLATRYEKTASSCNAMILLGSITLCLKKSSCPVGSHCAYVIARCHRSS
ncbi:transposase [Catalinimonas alkaloidigena]|uniref:transposase n=1 Tax=Catalinimonas alkaloidigena TaxID=1075417 RepID=UPI000B7FF249